MAWESQWKIFVPATHMGDLEETPGLVAIWGVNQLMEDSV